jgi:hypothetical protein
MVRNVRTTCYRGLWWRSALQTSLSSWNRTIWYQKVVYRHVFYADNAHAFPRCTCVLVFQAVFEIMLCVPMVRTCVQSTIWYVRTIRVLPVIEYVHVYVRTYGTYAPVVRTMVHVYHGTRVRMYVVHMYIISFCISSRFVCVCKGSSCTRVRTRVPLVPYHGMVPLWYHGTYTVSVQWYQWYVPWCL